MIAEKQEVTAKEMALNRREFLSTVATAAGLMTLGWGGSRAALAVESSTGGQGAAPRNDIYRIHPLSEHELLQMYARMLEEACAYTEPDWRTSAFSAAAGYWGDGVSSGNEGIRTVVSMMLACATLLKYGDGLAAGVSSNLLTKSIAGLRYCVATHRTGAEMCTDGKPWGATPDFGPGSWQSGMWTGTLAIAAWLMWDRLDATLRQGFERVIAWEDDILSHRPPPNGLWLDTKAEENGWEVPCLVLGPLMFLSNPHAGAWREAATRYMLNTLCTEADAHDTTLVDGRPMDEWVKGANLQPDYTLENHNIFHPAYVACSCYFLTQAAMYFTYGGKPTPQAASHHLLDTWHMFQSIVLPWGETAYPQSMDWELHAVTYVNLYASLATHWRDPFAARMEQCSLQYLRAWQMMGRGSLATPGSRLGITRHAVNAEQVSYGLLAHKIFAEAAKAIPAGAAAAEEEGVRDYPYVDFIAHRTLKKFASFSWKNRIMGVLMPIGEGHEGNPDFTVPIHNGFTGSFDVSPRGDEKIVVIEQERKKTPDGFLASGTLLLHGGRLKQRLQMISIGAQTVVYEDRVTAVSSVTIESEQGIPLGIENDQITGGTRVVTSQDGEMVMDWQAPRPPAPLSGSWVNVDGRLGVVMLSGSGMAYVQGKGYTPGICVCTDILYGSFSQPNREFGQDEQGAHRSA
jgi:hypothetical protein